MEALFKVWTSYLASGVEGVAGVLIALAALQATLHALLLFVRKTGGAVSSQEPETENIRLRLGRWLALALELELGADILRTAIAPTWAEIGQLAAIATIRTLLNYFLQKEIDRAALRQPKNHALQPYTSTTPSAGTSSNGMTEVARKSLTDIESSGKIGALGDPLFYSLLTIFLPFFNPSSLIELRTMLHNREGKQRS